MFLCYFFGCSGARGKSFFAYADEHKMLYSCTHGKSQIRYVWTIKTHNRKKKSNKMKKKQKNYCIIYSFIIIENSSQSAKHNSIFPFSLRNGWTINNERWQSSNLTGSKWLRSPEMPSISTANLFIDRTKLFVSLH